MAPLWIWAPGTVAFFILSVYLYGLNAYRRWQFRNFPGPKPSWLVGNLKELANKGLHQQRDEWQKEYGSIFVWWLGAQPIVTIADPDEARKVVLKMSHKELAGFASTSALARRFNSGMLPLLGQDMAKTIRSAWQPVFHSTLLSSYAEPMKEGAQRLLTRLQSAEEEGAEVNIWRLLGDMTMDVVGTTAFGVDLQTQADASVAGSGQDPSKDFTAAAMTLFGNGLSSIGKQPLMFLPLFFPFLKPLLARVSEVLASYKLLPKPLQVLDSAWNLLGTKSLELTRDARRAYKAMGTSDEIPKVGSFLHRMAASGKNLDDDQIAAQAFAFIIAGYETTANTLGFSMYCLATNPEAMARAQREVDAFAASGQQPSFNDMDKFPYLEAVVNETLRLFPPVTGTIPRRTTEPTVLCGQKIPNNVNVVVNVRYMHRDSAHFKDPLSFKPERFLKGDPGYENIHPYAHLPFGGGARVCIGQRFAMEEIKLTLVAVLSKFSFELSPGQVPIQLNKGVTQGPEDGIFGKIVSRPALYKAEQ